MILKWVRGCGSSGASQANGRSQPGRAGEPIPRWNQESPIRGKNQRSFKLQQSAMKEIFRYIGTPRARSIVNNFRAEFQLCLGGFFGRNFRILNSAAILRWILSHRRGNSGRSPDPLTSDVHRFELVAFRSKADLLQDIFFEVNSRRQFDELEPVLTKPENSSFGNEEDVLLLLPGKLPRK